QRSCRVSCCHVSRLQHHHEFRSPDYNIRSSATFRPTVRLMAFVLCSPRAGLSVERTARGLGPLDNTPSTAGVLFPPRRQGGLLGEWPRMAAPSRKRRLSDEARRALELLVGERGSTEALMLAHGFTDRMLRRLVRAGLITIRHEMIEADAKAKAIEVGNV